MSNLRRDIYKGSISTEKTGNTNDDFNLIFNQRLNNYLNNENNEFIEQRNNSLKSILSKTESRQNSLLSNLIDPIDSSDNESDRNNSSNYNKLYDIDEIIKTLTSSSRLSTRLGIGQIEREILLSHLYRMTISSNNEIYFGINGPNEADLLSLINSFKSSGGEESSDGILSFEWEIWLRCIISYSCMGNEEVSSEVIEYVLPLLFKIISKLDSSEGEPVSIIEYKKIDLSIWSLMSCILFIYFNSENYGIIEYTKIFLNYISNDLIIDDNIIKSSLFMVGISLSLAWESGRNVDELIEDQILETIKLVLVNKKHKIETKMVASVIVGLCYDIIEFNKKIKKEQESEKDTTDEEYEFINEQFELIKGEIQTLSNEGSKKIGKKGKDAKNIFKQVLNTMNNSSDDDDELDSIKISKSKNLKVSSWFSYIRIQVLKFILGSELSNWLNKSRDIKNMLKMTIKSSNNYSYNYNNEEDDEEDGEIDNGLGFNKLSVNNGGKSDKERTIQINKERRAKEEKM